MSTTARIEAGAELLDLLNPGWAGLIDLNRLDIEFENDCALAGLYGSYTEGSDELFAACEEIDPDRAAADHGFFAYAALGVPADDLKKPAIADEYADLTSGWLNEIYLRQMAMA